VKRTVVLFGALGTTPEMWAGQLPALEEFEVVRCDHPDEPTIDAMALRVVRMLDDLGVDEVSFCGASLGGAVGMRLALTHPERIGRLVLCCTSRRFATPESWDQRAATVREHGLEAIADAQVERWFTPEFPDVRRYRQMLLSIPTEAYARCCEALRDWDVRGALGAIPAQTFVVAGADDPAVPVGELQAIAEEIPQSTLQVLERARHLANVERAREFNEALNAHLAA
jgi:3-oxoadipate enol-lactonase